MKLLKYFILFLIFISTAGYVWASELTIEAEKQEYNDQKKAITLEKEVKVSIDDINIMSPRAFLTINENGKPDTATFVDGAKAIQVTKNGTSETKANILKISLLNKKVEATGDVSSKIEKLGKPTITIKSDYQSYDTNLHLMEVKNNVIMTYGDIRATANNAKIWISQKQGLEFIKLIGNAKIIQDKVMVTGSEVDLNAKTEVMSSRGSAYTNVKIDDVENVKIWSNSQQYNNKTNTAIASGGVKIHYETYVATGPKAVMLANPKTKKPNQVLFSGRSKIKDGDKSIEADKITITMNPKNFTAEGNVKTRIENLDNVSAGNQ